MLRRLALIALLLAPTGAWAQVRGEWISWARDHHYPIASIVSTPTDQYADLQFLRRVLDGRRIVELGESGHGVAEFSQAKVRLIKFLHEQMGFDVMAFESGLFECYMANQLTGSGSQMMQYSIFGVWHTEDVRELFNYIKQTQQTDRPLILAGFDTQTSSSAGTAQRPRFLHSVIDAVDHDYAHRSLQRRFRDRNRPSIGIRLRHRQRGAPARVLRTAVEIPSGPPRRSRRGVPR